MNRLGTAAAITTTPGTAPAYGTAFDMSTLFMDHETFIDMARSVAEITQQQNIAMMQAGVDPTLRQKELEVARNYEETGYSMEDSSFNNRDDDDSAWYTEFGNELLTGAHQLRNLAGRAITDVVESGVAPTYEEYNKKGGLLTEAEWDSFSPSTQQEMYNRAEMRTDFSNVADTPGISHVLGAFEKAYRYTTTGVDMFANLEQDRFQEGKSFLDSIHPLFTGKAWKAAYEESATRSLGNAFVDSLLSPYVKEETLDRWKRDSSWYQISSFGTEFATTWYLDTGVIAGKAAGSVARVARNELPLNESGRIATTIRRAQMGQDISDAGRYASWRAERILEGQNKVTEYARQTPFEQFARLPMFRNRAVDGIAGAKALHIAANSDNPELIDLTWKAFAGDLPSLARIKKMQENPAEAAKFGGGAQTFIDALNATRTKAQVLTDEIARLKADSSGTPFHRWEVHAEARVKEEQLAQAKSVLDAYDDDYVDWLNLVRGETKPELGRYGAPSARQVERFGDGSTRRFYMNNQFGYSHHVVKLAKATVLKKAGTAALHDIDSVDRTVTRYFQQLGQILDFEDVDDLRSATMRRVLSNADKPHEIYKALYDMEDNVLIPALANKLGISTATTKSVFDFIEKERNRTIDGVLSGKGRVYESAPSTAQRLMDDADPIRLVDGPDDEGMVTIELMDGTNRTTITTHESQLIPRRVPVDPTQTPNYYQPADVRHLYHEMKRHEDVLRDVDAGIAKRGMAEVAKYHDIWGTKFYNAWKPAQLWRLGWPQRVLMDEGLRAMAILGPMYWITGAGADAAATAVRNIPAWVYDKRHPLQLGDGPINPKKTPFNPAARDGEMARAVQYEAHAYPKVNPSRLNRISKVATAYDDLYRAEQARRAYAQAHPEPDPAHLDDYSEYLYEEAEWTRTHAANVSAHQARRDAAARRVAELGGPLDVLPRMYEEWRSRVHYGDQSEIKHQDIPLIFDPINGKEVQQGFVVPLPDLGPSVKLGGADFLDGKNFAYWYAQNQELLARSGIRLAVMPDGSVQVARHFSGRNARRRAAEELKRVAESRPVGEQGVGMFDLAKGERYYAMDVNAISPMMETLNRSFHEQADPDVLVTDVETPAAGVPQVFHGTAEGDLPERLLPREEVDLARGHMVGPGFYTSVSLDLVNQYAWSGKVYTIRSSRTGQQYDIFDLDQEITQADFDELRAYIAEHPDAGGSEGLLEDAYNTAKRLRALEKRGRQASAYGSLFNTKKLPRYTQISWGNLFERIDDFSQTNKIVSRFLEERRNAGALTHTGGTNNGPGHQVYVWLHPEDLEVIPAYAPSGTWQKVESWFSNPESQEMPYITNPVPENRIVRYGKKNPMLRDLHTVHAKIEARKADLKGRGKGALADPEVRQMVVREQALMDALGLEYRGRGLITDAQTNAFGQDWYEVADADKFNRTMNEAREANEEFDYAAALRGELRKQEEAAATGDQMDMEELDFHLENWSERMANRLRKGYGEGHTVIRAGDGSNITIPNAFEGHVGQIMRGLVSSSKAVDDLTAGHGGALSLLRRAAAGHKTYKPPVFDAETLTKGTKKHRAAVHYFHQWTDLVNDQIGNSPIWSRMLKGKSDEQITKWLAETAEGSRVRREIIPEGQSVELYVNQHRAMLNYYVPSAKVQRLLAKGRISPSDLRRNVANENLPDVFGPDVELLSGNFLNRLADGIWKGLGTIPIDKLSRQPFAKAVYDAKMQALAAAQPDGKWITNDVIQEWQQIAHQHTLNEVRKTLFDLTDATNMTDAIRFIAPFWNAQQEALTKWAKIISDRPETVMRFFNGQRAIYRNFVVMDEENNEVQSNQREGGLYGLGMYHPNDKVIMNIPDWMRKTPLGEGLEQIGTLGIPLGSANTVLQGEMPMLPSPGPWLTMPVDKFLRTVSKTQGVTHDEDFLYRWLFPIGRPSGGFKGVMEQLSPGWGRRLLGAQGGEDDVAWVNLYTQVGREMQVEAEKNGDPMPSPEDIEKAANHLWAVRMFVSFVSPVQTEFRPRHQFWVDEAHRYRQEIGPDWFDQYVADYGKEAAIYAISSSNSTTGVPPTKLGMEEWDRNSELIRKHPAWGEAIISPDSYTDDYSQDAYRAQFDINLGPGTDERLRDLRDPEERFGEAEKRLGWLAFRQIDAAVEAQLAAAGLSSIQQTQAAPLARWKAEQVASLKEQYPAWSKDYSVREDTIDQDVRELASFAFDKQFDKRPDFQGVRQYLLIRDQATQVLQGRYSQGGSRSLQSEENADLAQWFYANVGALIQANPSFAEFYSRHLDADQLLTGGM